MKKKWLEKNRDRLHDLIEKYGLDYSKLKNESEKFDKKVIIAGMKQGKIK